LLSETGQQIVEFDSRFVIAQLGHKPGLLAPVSDPTKRLAILVLTEPLLIAVALGVVGQSVGPKGSLFLELLCVGSHSFHQIVGEKVGQNRHTTISNLVHVGLRDRWQTCR